MKVRWSPLAEQRAAEAFDYIAKDRPSAAVNWLEALLDRVAALERFAKRGRVVPEIGRSPYRQLVLPPYRVIYRVDSAEVVILTVRHSKRAWNAEEIDRAED